MPVLFMRDPVAQILKLLTTARHRRDVSFAYQALNLAIEHGLDGDAQAARDLIAQLKAA